MIRTRRSEKKKLEDEAMRLRAEADSAAIRGQSGMQLHGMGNNSRRLLEEGRFRNKHCEVLVSCSNWGYWIDLIELHARDTLSKAVISTACQL